MTVLHQSNGNHLGSGPVNGRYSVSKPPVERKIGVAAIGIIACLIGVVMAAAPNTPTDRLMGVLIALGGACAVVFGSTRQKH